MTACGDDFARKLAKASLHAISDDRPAHFLANGKADALQRIAVMAIADEKDEPRRCRALSGVRSKEVRAFAKDG